MGLKDVFVNAAETIVNAVDDIAENAYYYQVGSSRYNVSSGAVSVIDARYLVSGVFSKYKAMEIDNTKILPRDLKLTQPQKTFTPTPHVKDYVQRLEQSVSVRYEVIDVEQDSAGAVWMIQLRKP